MIRLNGPSLLGLELSKTQIVIAGMPSGIFSTKRAWSNMIKIIKNGKTIVFVSIALNIMLLLFDKYIIIKSYSLQNAIFFIAFICTIAAIKYFKLGAITSAILVLIFFCSQFSVLLYMFAYICWAINGFAP
jgi:hypothetical protein